MFTAFTLSGKNEIILLLHEYAGLNRQYLEAYHKKDIEKQKEIGKKINTLHEQKFIPALTEVKSIFCDTKNREILQAYIDVLEVTGHSASEASRWTFAEMYICHPEFVLNAIRKSEKKQQVISDLIFGFENIISTIDTTTLDVSRLRQKIVELQKP